jgi:hypothetical protein
MASVEHDRRASMGHLPQLPALSGDAYTMRIDIPDYILAV